MYSYILHTVHDTRPVYGIRYNTAVRLVEKGGRGVAVAASAFDVPFPNGETVVDQCRNRMLRVELKRIKTRSGD